MSAAAPDARVGGALLALALTLAALHASPFWPQATVCGLVPCDGGLFGLGWLPAGGDWVARALRGTWLAQAALPVWGIGTILALSLAERLLRRR